MHDLIIVSRGMRGKMADAVDVTQTFQVSVEVAGPSVYDYCCFGLDKAEKLSDDRYMVFYNQEETPEGAIRFRGSGKKGIFTVQLSRIPDTIQRLAFSVSIDGNSTMDRIYSHTVQISQNQRTQLEMSFRGKDFRKERAILTIELYRHNGEWKFRGVGQGFEGGLKELLQHFGGETPEPPPAVSPPKPTPLKTNSSTPPENKPPKPEPLQPEPLKSPVPPLPTEWSVEAGSEVEIGLRWEQRNGQAALRLGCLYELQDGTKGSVQWLNGEENACRNIILRLQEGREVLCVYPQETTGPWKMLLFAYVDAGASNWSRIQGRVAIRYREDREIEIPIAPDKQVANRMCAIASLNINGSMIKIKKEMSFFSNQREIDGRWNWHLRWLP